MVTREKEMVIIFLGKSGSGKDTIAKKVAEKLNIKKIITNTTREKRPGEIDGINYHYKTKEEFMKDIQTGKMIEWTIYPQPDGFLEILERHNYEELEKYLQNQTKGNFYGISIESFKEALKNGLAYCIVDIRGLFKIREMGYNNVSFFIDVSNEETLKERMRERGDNEKSIKERIEQLKKDEKAKKYSDYVVVNEEIEETVEKIIKIIKNRLNNN